MAAYSKERVTSGFESLDSLLDGLRIGDNVVWAVDRISDYQSFVTPYVQSAIQEGRDLIYLRFGEHPPLLAPQTGLTIYELDPSQGFESFAARIHTIITLHGRGAFYVFDCLSELLTAWANDQMVANFFWITCPYLYELDTLAYFALIRGRQSQRSINRIKETTQVLIDLYYYQDQVYVHPVKVWERHSPTMFLPHLKKGEDLYPVDNSFEATNLLSEIFKATSDMARRQLDHWHHLFIKATEIAKEQGEGEERDQMVRHLCHHMIGRDERILELARKYLTLEDLLRIKSRMIGTGFIGGKAVGMLLAREILCQDASFDWTQYLEGHDSFHVGSNTYYGYIVHNGWWKLFMEQKSPERYFAAGAELQEKMLHGEFPPRIREQFQKTLEYYGQYPIIVRSSSLLEDGFGNAFAGKYDSFFCANQGTPEQRMEEFENAIRKIFASAMSEDALTYRKQRGLDQKEEQMALLVQRVSGCYHNQYYLPDLAGVGVSYNTFVWDKDLDPQAGMLRLVLGLGTRAVDRVEGDYPRIVALDAPLKKPHKGGDDTRKFSQRDVDLVDVNRNSLETVHLTKLLKEVPDIPIERFGVKDHEAIRLLEERGRKGDTPWLLTFDHLLSKTSFTELMQRMLKTLEAAYDYPVDVEFTVNFDSEQRPRINPVQCRPLQTKGQEMRVEIPEDKPEEQIFFRSEGNFMGGNISQPIKWFIWVEPEEYTRLSMSDKYEIARLIGRINKRIGDKKKTPTLLMGPGRWGTTTPSLGVPITFSEISNITALAEVAFTSGDLMPELSFGSHFFQDLVETDIFYLALFPENKEVFLNKAWMDSLPNALEGLMPASSRFKSVIKVCQLPDNTLHLAADVITQKLLCYR